MPNTTERQHAPCNPLDGELPVWRAKDGLPIPCTEKIKVLNENFRELRQMAKDAIEDAMLMGCSEQHLRIELHRLIDTLRLDFTD